MATPKKMIESFVHDIIFAKFWIIIIYQLDSRLFWVAISKYMRHIHPIERNNNPSKDSEKVAI